MVTIVGYGYGKNAVAIDYGYYCRYGYGKNAVASYISIVRFKCE